MRLATAVHDGRPWLIQRVAADLTVEDVWALPVEGSAQDFPTLVELVAAIDPAGDGPLPRLLWAARDWIGRWFGLGRVAASDGPDDGEPLSIPGTKEVSLVDRLPDELRGTASHLRSAFAPFTPLYMTDDEFAAELSNRTVHAVLHLAWVDHGDGRHRGQMAVYVKPRGRFGKGYMAFIKPFRHLVVYPAFLRQIERAWNARAESRR